MMTKEERKAFKTKFTLQDILYLMDMNEELDEKIIIAEDAEKETWMIVPINSPFITAELKQRHVYNIYVWDDILQVWLTKKED